MAGPSRGPATQVPPSPQKESTNLHYPLNEKRCILTGTTCSARLAGLEYRSGLAQALQRERERLLEQVLDPREELGAVGAVQDAVVAHQGERHLIAGDHLALVVHRGLLRELADGEDRRLRRVDDRG